MSKTAVVYSKTTCPWCVKAKQILTEAGIEVDERILGVAPDAIDKVTLEQTLGVEVKTVPQIVFVNDDGSREYIGGCTDLATRLGVQL